MSDGWSAGDTAADFSSGRQYQPRQQTSLEESLGEAEVCKMIDEFMSGEATHQELADRYRTSTSSVKRLLGKRGARLWVMEQKRVHKRRRPA